MLDLWSFAGGDGCMVIFQCGGHTSHQGWGRRGLALPTQSQGNISDELWDKGWPLR